MDVNIICMTAQHFPVRRQSYGGPVNQVGGSDDKEEVEFDGIRQF